MLRCTGEICVFVSPAAFQFMHKHIGTLPLMNVIIKLTPKEAQKGKGEIRFHRSVVTRNKPVAHIDP